MFVIPDRPRSGLIRNLEIPGSMLTHRPGMTEFGAIFRPFSVMAGLVPAIHVLQEGAEIRGCPCQGGHDEGDRA